MQHNSTTNAADIFANTLSFTSNLTAPFALPTWDLGCIIRIHVYFLFGRKNSAKYRYFAYYTTVYCVLYRHFAYYTGINTGILRISPSFQEPKSIIPEHNTSMIPVSCNPAVAAQSSAALGEMRQKQNFEH